MNFSDTTRFDLDSFVVCRPFNNAEAINNPFSIYIKSFNLDTV